MRFKISYLFAILFFIILSVYLLKTLNISSRKNQNSPDSVKKIENVILLIACSLRADHLGCYEYERDTSPNIDQLAKEGVIYRNCFAQAPFTVGSVPAI